MRYFIPGLVIGLAVMAAIWLRSEARALAEEPPREEASQMDLIPDPQRGGYFVAQNYGQGVYDLIGDDADMPRKLSLFLDHHPDLEVVAMSGHGSGYRSKNAGYFVIMRPRAECACPQVGDN